MYVFVLVRVSIVLCVPRYTCMMYGRIYGSVCW